MTSLIGVILLAFGLYNNRYQSTGCKSLRQILSSHHFNAILAIGANVGYYIKELRYLGYKGKIVSFQPIEKAFLELNQYKQKSGLYHYVNRALGKFDGKIEISFSENSVDSLLLEATSDPQTGQLRRVDCVFVHREMKHTKLSNDSPL